MTFRHYVIFKTQRTHQEPLVIWETVIMHGEECSSWYCWAYYVIEKALSAHLNVCHCHLVALLVCYIVFGFIQNCILLFLQSVNCAQYVHFLKGYIWNLSGTLYPSIICAWNELPFPVGHMNQK